eukprot:7249646-Pyramimonas_sp.AAC.1
MHLATVLPAPSPSHPAAHVHSHGAARHGLRPAVRGRVGFTSPTGSDVRAGTATEDGSTAAGGFCWFPAKGAPSHGRWP